MKVYDNVIIPIILWNQIILHFTYEFNVCIVAGTNYPPAIYDPLKWSKESYYEELAKIQKTEMDRLEKERKSKVEFVSGTKKHEDDKKRKSKWDQPGGSISAGAVKPAGLVQPSLTTTATGTKGTVISAFGSLPKKPRPWIIFTFIYLKIVASCISEYYWEVLGKN